MSIIYHQCSPKVLKVTALLPDLAPIEPASLLDLKTRMGSELQYGNDVGKLMRERMFVLQSPWESIVETDAGVFHRWAKRGWVTDFGSIPGVAECIEKRDDRRMLCAYLNHDIDFGTHFLSCAASGCQLYQTGRHFGKPALSSWWVWNAVTGGLAERIYNEVEVSLNYERRWAGGEWIAKRGECDIEHARRLAGQPGGR